MSQSHLVSEMETPTLKTAESIFSITSPSIADLAALKR
jgi:hypothetical protein